MDKATTAKKSQIYDTLKQTDLEHVKTTFTVLKHQFPMHTHTKHKIKGYQPATNSSTANTTKQRHKRILFHKASTMFSV